MKVDEIMAQQKSDLDKYLAAKLHENEPSFDILTWWRDNTPKYKILSLLARDVLVVPVSTVASESCFSTGGRVLDVYRSSLSPKMVEALICTQNWLKSKFNFPERPYDQYDETESAATGKFCKSYFYFMLILFYSYLIFKFVICI